MIVFRFLTGCAAVTSLTAASLAKTDDGFSMSEMEYETSTHAYEFVFDFENSADTTCPYLDPRWRHLFQEDWEPEVAYHPDPDRLSGMILRVPSNIVDLADEPGSAILTHVGYHDDDWNLSYSVFYHALRVERVSAACVALDENRSQILLRVMIIGTHALGAGSATEYVESGQLEADMRRYREGIRAAIAD